MELSVRKIAKYVVACVLFVPIFYVVIPLWLIHIGNNFGIPILSFPGQKVIGAMITLIGLALFPYCSLIFFKYGKRTPLFTETKGSFFKKGLYQYTRNPMYVGHVLVALGIFVWNGSLLLLLYTLAGWLVLHLYLILVEEPQLKNRYGKTYEEYKYSVPRWIGLIIK